jgi:hypothetical protein
MTQTQLVNISNGVTLTIGTRKRATPTKPPYFLLLITPKGDRVYLSSLYPDPLKQAKNGLQGYRFEVDGVWYGLLMDKDQGQATIIQDLEIPGGGKIIGLNYFPDCANSINNAQLGSKSDPILPKMTLSGLPRIRQIRQKTDKKGKGIDPKTGEIGEQNDKKGGSDGQI